MRGPSCPGSIDRAPTHPRPSTLAVVAVDSPLQDWLHGLQTALEATRVRVVSNPDDALVWITDQTDPATLQDTLRVHPSLVIIAIGHFDRDGRHDHRRLVDALNAGAAAYLLDPSTTLLAVHIRCVGRHPSDRRPHSC